MNLPRPLPDRPNLRHLKDQAKDLLKAGAAASITDAQFQIARLYGFASWPKLKAHIDSLEEIGQLKQAIDTNDIVRVKTMMTRNSALNEAYPEARVEMHPADAEMHGITNNMPVRVSSRRGQIVLRATVTEKTAVFAPIPIASSRIAVSVNAGVRRSVRAV